LPSHHAQDIPEALDALVIRMLALDPQLRPNSAVELLEQLAAISGDTHQAVDVQAYLTAPNMIGRSTPLLGVRRRMLRALRGHGASVFVTGPSGVGRSRFLDACALEAKLTGAMVLRAGPADATGDFAAARALLEQLRAQLSAAELEQFSIEVGSNERSSLQSQLTEYVTHGARRQSLAIIVDDVEDFDEPSLSLLGSLAQLARRHKLVLMCASAADLAARPEQAWRVLRAHSRTLALTALDAQQLEDMLQSVFGAIPSLKLLATRIHGLSAGLPRLVMEHPATAGPARSRQVSSHSGSSQTQNPERSHRS
jgi:ABC-type iron transport system FetAB ATPase subunit